MQPLVAGRVRWHAGASLAVAGAFSAGAWATTWLASKPGDSALIWPPAGIAFVCALVLGRRALAGLLPASLLFFVWADRHAAGGTDLSFLLVDVSKAVGAAVQPFIVLGIFRWLCQGRPSLDRPKDVLALAAAAMGGGAVSPAWSAISLTAAGIPSPPDPERTLAIAWLSEAIAVLLIGSLALGFGERPARSGRLSRWLEAVALGATTLVLTFVVLARFPVLGVLGVVCLWAAYRFGSRGVASASLAAALLGVWTTSHVLPPVVTHTALTRHEFMLVVQAMFTFVTLAGLMLAAALAERARAEAVLEQERARLEVRIRERTENLSRLAAGLEKEAAVRQRAEIAARALARVIREVNAVHELREVLRRIVAAALELLNARAGSAALLDDGELRFTEFSDRRHSASIRFSFKEGQGVAGWVMQTRRPYSTNDAARDEKVDAAFRSALGFSSLLNTPILDRQLHLLGDLEIWDKEGGFLPEDVELMQGLSAGAAVAIENVELLKALQEADRRKDEFLAMLGHELRNPLAAMRTAVYLFRQPGLPGSMVRARDTVDRQVTHMSRLVDDLLDVSRVRYGKINLRTQPLDVEQLVRSVLFDRRADFDSRRVALRTRFSPGPKWVSGDPTRLAQVLENLLGNALKFTDPGGWIEVRLADADGQIEMAVVDSGIGMDRPTLERLFEPFTQADSSLAHSRGGLGLGLPLAKGLVELHGGRVEATSQGIGHGSTLTVYLPKSVEGGVPAVAPRGLGVARSRRVLLIEDNADFADALHSLLSAWGHVVEVAAAGREGLRKADAFHPEVVLCDIGLPDIDGFEVARQLRASPGTRSARLAAVTGYGSEEARRRSHEAGFDVHLTKPLDDSALRRVLA